jgi:predicted Holliday junction resolvase-like endonuclease
MKTQTIFRIFSLSLLFALLGSVAMGQTKQEKEIKEAQEAEKKAKQAQIEHQHQEMKEQQLKMKELEKVYTEQARTSGRARSSSATTGVAPGRVETTTPSCTPAPSWPVAPSTSSAMPATS